jgi:zinc protease
MNLRFSSCLATVVVLLAAAGRAAADTPMYDYREVVLDNGLRIVTLEDFSCPVVAVQLWYHVGSKDEDPERQGFAHMFEHMMFRGTDRLGPTDHFDFIRRTGGDCNAYTSFDNTTYVQKVPANQLELALWLEAERMTFLKIDQNSFDTERKVVEEERRLGINRPYGTVPEKVLPQIIKQHPYRWLPIGQIPHLRAAAVQELRDFWTRYYVPNNATLVIVGAVMHAEAQRLARRYFEWIPRYPDPPRVTIQEPQPTAAQSIDVREDNTPAPVVGVVYRTVPMSHPDSIPLQMLAMVLGGGESSRLYRELVADKQFAVMAAAIAFALEQDGLFGAGAVMSPMSAKAKTVAEIVDRHIERLRSKPVSVEELTKVRNQMLKNAVTGNLTVESKARLLGEAAVLHGDTARVNRQLALIRAVTADDLLRVARTHLDPQRAVRINIEANLLGTLLGRKKSEEDAPITATPETDPPPPGRAGLARPIDFPAAPPVEALLDWKPTPRWSEHRLSNGLKVLVVPNPEVPFVTASLRFRAGAWTEEKPGTANMALGLLTKGTTKHSDEELARELETYAISLSGDCGMDSSSVSANCLPEHLERALGFMGEVVLTATFPDTEFAKLRQQLRTALAISQAEPAYVADRELRRRLYGTHPYARTATGELEDLAKLSADDCRGWWLKFARPDMATLIVAGDVTPEQAVALAEKSLGGWKVETPQPDVRLPDMPASGPIRIYLVDRPGVQSQIRAAQRSIGRESPDYFVASVVSGYFGGAFNSRLNETIRVKKGLTYGARGGFSAQRMSGQFGVSTFSKTESTVEAVKAIFDELARLQNDAPSDKELSDTKSYIIGSFPGDRETPQQVAGELWLLESYGLPADYFERYLAGVAAASAADCQRVVGQTVNPAELAVVVVGSAAKLKDELAKIAPVEVVKPAAPRPADDRADSGDQ